MIESSPLQAGPEVAAPRACADLQIQGHEHPNVYGSARTSSLRVAKLDGLLSLSGVLLVMFMWGHMFFVASILISNDAMWTVTRMFEGYFLFGQPYPGIVSAMVTAVWLLLVAHVILALRRIPVSAAQFRAFTMHRQRLDHPDTTSWWVQIVTGFALLFLASPHLFQMLVNPAEIGPYASSDRVWSGHWWALYLPMLFCVELHAGFGLYRVAVKWGVPGAGDPLRQRDRLLALKWFLMVFFLGLGILTLATYMKIGQAHQSQLGHPYVPAFIKPAKNTPPIPQKSPATRPEKTRPDPMLVTQARGWV